MAVALSASGAVIQVDRGEVAIKRVVMHHSYTGNRRPIRSRARRVFPPRVRSSSRGERARNGRTRVAGLAPKLGRLSRCQSSAWGSVAENIYGDRTHFRLMCRGLEKNWARRAGRLSCSGLRVRQPCFTRGSIFGNDLRVVDASVQQADEPEVFQRLLRVPFGEQLVGTRIPHPEHHAAEDGL